MEGGEIRECTIIYIRILGGFIITALYYNKNKESYNKNLDRLPIYLYNGIIKRDNTAEEKEYKMTLREKYSKFTDEEIMNGYNYLMKEVKESMARMEVFKNRKDAESYEDEKEYFERKSDVLMDVQIIVEARGIKIA